MSEKSLGGPSNKHVWWTTHLHTVLGQNYSVFGQITQSWFFIWPRTTSVVSWVRVLCLHYPFIHLVLHPTICSIQFVLNTTSPVSLLCYSNHHYGHISCFWPIWSFFWWAQDLSHFTSLLNIIQISSFDITSRQHAYYSHGGNTYTYWFSDLHTHTANQCYAWTVEWTIVHEIVHVLGVNWTERTVFCLMIVIVTGSLWHLWTALSHSLTLLKRVPDFHRAFQVKRILYQWNRINGVQ